MHRACFPPCPPLLPQTIIEALKYITTGQHPAGGNGAAFVHDPKVRRRVSGAAAMLWRSTMRASGDGASLYLMHALAM